MLCSGLDAADAALARRDPALPGLELLLDDAAFTEVLAAAFPAAGLCAARSTYVRYKRATSCLIAYAVADARGGETLAYARAQRPDDRAKLVGNVRRAAVDGHWGCATALPERDIAIYPFGSDRRLRALGALASPERRRRLVARRLPDRPGLAGAVLRPLRYKPERRFVARLEGDGDAALVKLYGDGFERALAATRHVPVPTPARLARSRRRRLLVFEWLGGETAAALLARGDVGGAAAAGQLLAALHRGGGGLGPAAPERPLAATAEAVAAVAALVPSLGDTAARVLGRSRAALRAAGAPAPIHGDFSADQVLLAPQGPLVLDLDRAAVGDPAEDLATFLAGLEAAVVRGQLPRGSGEDAARALLDGYCDGGGRPADDGRLRRLTAAALLRLAPEPFRHRDPDWAAATETLVARAGELAG